ncbi:MAG: fatty acid desaturase [Polyangiales bacterium]|nr:fatty acid desaturase [Sandaracinaceae bacterium]
MTPRDPRPSLRGPLLVFGLYLVATFLALRWLHAAPGFSSAAGFGVARGWFALLALVQYLGIGVGVGLVYHRVLVHRAAKMHPALAYPLVAFVLPAGTPVQWVGNHRHHHAATDTDADAHSPVRHGFWVAHAGWYIGRTEPWLCALYSLGGPLRMVFDAFWRPRSNQEHVRFARDIARVPFYAAVSRPTPYAVLVLGHVFLSWLVAYACFGVWALPLLYLQQLTYFVLGDAVNSLLHLVGRQTWKSGDSSRDNPVLALLTFGEGWHNGHHAFPSSVRSGLLPGQIDVLYLIARGLERVGLMSELVVPSREELLARLDDHTQRARLGWAPEEAAA